jgi:hypothetical protein
MIFSKGTGFNYTIIKLLRNWHIEAMTYGLNRVLRGEIKR